MLTLKMNDAAVDALGVLTGLSMVSPPGGLAPGLRERAGRGVVRRGKVLVWADSTGGAERAPSRFPDLTGWECADSSFHLEDVVPVTVATDDEGQPSIDEADQRLLLLQGVAFALEVGRLVHALQPPASVRCIIGVNDTNGTFRFHQIRAGEYWNLPDLDGYRLEKAVVVDIEPAAT
jgi:hypothetical protein